MLAVGCLRDGARHTTGLPSNGAPDTGCQCAGLHRDPDADTLADTNPYLVADADADPYCNGDAHRYTDCHPITDADALACAHPTAVDINTRRAGRRTGFRQRPGGISTGARVELRRFPL